MNASIATRTGGSVQKNLLDLIHAFVDELRNNTAVSPAQKQVIAGCLGPLEEHILRNRVPARQELDAFLSVAGSEEKLRALSVQLAELIDNAAY